MNLKNILPPFYVGQTITAINTGHPLSRRIINCEYIVLGIKKYPCGCWAVHIGVKIEGYFITCHVHGQVVERNPGVYWQSASHFKGKEAEVKIATFTEIKKVEKEEILTLN